MIEAPEAKTSYREQDNVEINRTEDKWTNVMIDSQILSTFMSCPTKYNYIFNRHLIPLKGISPSIEKGQLAHIGLHGYWKARLAGEDYQKASVAGLEAAKRSSLTFQNLSQEDALDCFQNLIAYYKFISNTPWIPVFVEQHFKFIAYEDPSIKLRIILTGRIDLGLKSPSLELMPVDNKSEGERWFYSQMSNQFRIYALACKTNILGVQRFGFQKTIEEKDRFKLEILPFDEDTLEEWRTVTLPYYVKQLLICMEDGYWPMNTTSCVHGHFKCQFSDAYNGGICNVSRTVREQKLEAYFKIGEEWNPENF